MKTRKVVCAGAIAFIVDNGEIKILQLLANKPGEHYLEIGPKGHLEKGESLLQAANREMREEIGIPLHIDSNFREEENYSFVRKNPQTGNIEKIKKKVVYFLAFMARKDLKRITLSEEHIRYFIVPIDKAVEEASFEEQKPVLKNAKGYILRHYYLT
jgi:8-oxo-dGTP pyrophosphatase MutT (NUDIX family)